MSGIKLVFASPLEKIHPMVVNPTGGLEHPGGRTFKGQLDMLNLSNLLGQEENASNLPSISWGDVLISSRSRFGMYATSVEPTGAKHDYGNGPSPMCTAASNCIIHHVLSISPSTELCIASPTPILVGSRNRGSICLTNFSADFVVPWHFLMVVFWCCEAVKMLSVHSTCQTRAPPLVH
jgi:hypothetical protein